MFGLYLQLIDFEHIQYLVVSGLGKDFTFIILVCTSLMWTNGFTEATRAKTLTFKKKIEMHMRALLNQSPFAWPVIVDV